MNFKNYQKSPTSGKLCKSACKKKYFMTYLLMDLISKCKFFLQTLKAIFRIGSFQSFIFQLLFGSCQLPNKIIIIFFQFLWEKEKQIKLFKLYSVMFTLQWGNIHALYMSYMNWKCCPKVFKHKGVIDLYSAVLHQYCSFSISVFQYCSTSPG